jgi:hypothetical protein
MDYFEGLTLLAAGRDDEAQRTFTNEMGVVVNARLPDPLTPADFVVILAHTMVGSSTNMSIASLEATEPRLPPWAAGMFEISAGLKHMEAGKFESAALAFHRYLAFRPDAREQWAFKLRPLAEKLAGDCEAALDVLKQIDDLSRDGKYEAAEAVLQAAEAKPVLASLRDILRDRDPKLQPGLVKERQAREEAAQQAEAKKQEEEEVVRAHVEEEKKQLAAVEAQFGPLWMAYDFKGVITRYEAFAPQLATAGGKQALEERLTVVRLIADVKSQLIADLAKRPYERGDLQTRARTALTGTLSGVVDDELMFITRFGTVTVNWSDMAPTSLARVGEFYATVFAGSESAATRAHRYLVLTAFSKQYGLDSQVSQYAERVTKSRPDLRPQVDMILKGFN